MKARTRKPKTFMGMKRIGVNSRQKRISLRYIATDEKEDRTTPNQDAKQSFPLNSEKSIQPRRLPPSLPCLIGNKKCVLDSLLHYKSENEIGKWQRALSTLGSYI
jgi:hypothetical protein